MKVCAISYCQEDSYTGPPPRVVALAVDSVAAFRWIQDEVDGKHPTSGISYATGHSAEWWVTRGTFLLKWMEIHDAR